MIEFDGFPAKMRFTPVPNIVFSSLLPQITDLNELKLLLHLFEILYPKKGRLKFVTLPELLHHHSLMIDLKDAPQSTPEGMQKTLEALAAKNIILCLTVNQGEETCTLYCLNNEANRLMLQKIQDGEIVLPGIKPVKVAPVNVVESLDIFTVYEQNIGLLTPLIADEIREAARLYPEPWIRDAIKEAVSLNKRNWRYISRILENWLAEGKDNGAYRRNIKKNTDPDKYIRGKYGHMVQR